jgi:hypothetical protein
LAEWVACQQEGCELHELDAQMRKRAYIPLYQNHVPKLEKTGVVKTGDRRSIRISKGPTFTVVRDALRAVEQSLNDDSPGWLGRVLGNGGVADV